MGSAETDPVDVARIRKQSAGFALGSKVLWDSQAQLDTDFDAMAKTGARWVRFDLFWPVIEPERGRFDWKRTDRVVDAALSRDMRVVAVPAYTPAWARPPSSSDKYPPTKLRDYERFVRKAARRYSPRGVSVWEIWNEPNISGFWAPKPDPRRYARLLRRAEEAIKEVAPHSRVLVGGLAPAVDRSDGGAVSPMTFLQELYGTGARDAFDAVAIHPYSYPAMPMDIATQSWNTFYRLPLIHELMSSHGDRNKKIWSTEFGAPTGTGPNAVTEAGQAAIVGQGLEAIEGWSWTGPIFVYSYRDSGTNLSDREQNFGLTHVDGTEKPALQTFKRTLRNY